MKTVMVMKNIEIEYEVDMMKLGVHAKEMIDAEGDHSIPMVNIVMAPSESEQRYVRNV